MNYCIEFGRSHHFKHLRPAVTRSVADEAGHVVDVDSDIFFCMTCLQIKVVETERRPMSRPAIEQPVELQPLAMG